MRASSAIMARLRPVQGITETPARLSSMRVSTSSAEGVPSLALVAFAPVNMVPSASETT